MLATIRHFGIISTNLERTKEWYGKFTIKPYYHQKETWPSAEIEVMKMKDCTGGILEAIKGDWKPHIALTLQEGTFDDLWGEFATKAEVIMFRKGNVVYLKDPSGNWVEVVHEI